MSQVTVRDKVHDIEYDTLAAQVISSQRQGRLISDGIVPKAEDGASHGPPPPIVSTLLRQLQELQAVGGYTSHSAETF